MELFEKVNGRCQVRNADVEILMVALKKTKQKGGNRTPIRCQSASECPKSTFCRFVNPLTNHLPVDFTASDGTAEAS